MNSAWPPKREPCAKITPCESDVSVDVGDDLVRTAADVDADRFRHRRRVADSRCTACAAAPRCGCWMREELDRASDRRAAARSSSAPRRTRRRSSSFSFSRILLREVLRLGAILVDVVQLPAVLVEVADAADRRVQRGRLPAVLPDPARAEHRVVLHAASVVLRLGVVERVAHRDAVERILLDAAIDLRHLEPDDVEDRRHDVRRVVVLMAHLALRLDALGPVDDERIARAAGELRVALEHLERRAERDGPSGRVVVVRVRAARACRGTSCSRRGRPDSR